MKIHVVFMILRKMNFSSSEQGLESMLIAWGRKVSEKRYLSILSWGYAILEGVELFSYFYDCLHR